MLCSFQLRAVFFKLSAVFFQVECCILQVEFYILSYTDVVVVGPTPPSKNGGVVQQPFRRTPSDAISPFERNLGPLFDWCPPPFNQ